MGIKGIYKEIGSGQRISLTKLAVEHLEKHGKPLRLAIDISIWQFQVQAARGGSNPAIRTLFYRLLRLLGLSIQPVFVFDGPNKPAFKRNKRSGRGNGVATSMAKRMIRLFGFLVHDAPGEAEAECALLQRNGIVDAVLSEDVDTIMFGCTRTLRNWSAEGSKGSKAPTHVSLFDTAELSQGESGLDREGLVLVALMSGGDYIPEGIPGAGVKLACEAARAGFGISLCRLKRSDASGINAWRDNFIHELQTNERRFFRTKHKALTVPEDFPNLEVLRYYTHPVVSPSSALDRLKSQRWSKSLDILGLRDFVRETFDWNYKGGAIKFIRVLAPCLLVRKLMSLSAARENETVESLEMEESSIVKSIKSRRCHFSTDATPELRISFTPTEIVGYNFEKELDEEILYGRDGIALNSDDEFEAVGDEEGAETVTKPSSRKPFSPTEPDLSWIPETIAKLGIPLMVEDWEEEQRAKASRQKKTKAPPKQKTKIGGMAVGALDRYLKVSKSLLANLDVTPESTTTEKPRSPICSRNPCDIPAASTQSQSDLPTSTADASQRSRPFAKPTHKKSKLKVTGKVSQPDPKTNSWTIASSQPSPRAKRTTYSATSANTSDAIFISSSPPSSPSLAARVPVKSSPSDKENYQSVISPQKRQSTTPLREINGQRSVSGSTIRAISPTPCSIEKSRRKLARTESMPTSCGPSKEGQSGTSVRAPRGGLERSRTTLVAPSSFDSEDDDDELPPLSSLVGRLPKGPSSSAPVASASASYINGNIMFTENITQTVPVTAPNASVDIGLVPVARSTVSVVSNKTSKHTSKQARLKNVFSARTTKLYVPRKSQTGYLEEEEVTLEEAERRGRDNKGNHWRRSDISVIDLTGED